MRRQAQRDARQPNPQELGHWAARIGASFGQAWLEEAKALGNHIFTSAEYLNRQRSDEEYVADPHDHPTCLHDSTLSPWMMALLRRKFAR